MVRLGILIIVEQILENQGWSLLSVYHISVARTGMTSKEFIEHRLHQGTLIIMVKLGILIFDEQISETKVGLCRQLTVLA